MPDAAVKFIQLFVTGLVTGSVYALVALGFVLIYKSTSIINFAQGEFVLVGAYICLFLVQAGIPFIPAFALTMGASVLLGLGVERGVLRPMIGEPIISVIMVTIGLAFFLKSTISLIWGTQIRVFPPIFSQEPIHFGQVIVSEVYIYTFIFAVLFR
jgi:branched-chain amino acid transport system permease protein